MFGTPKHSYPLFLKKMKRASKMPRRLTKPQLYTSHSQVSFGKFQVLINSKFLLVKMLSESEGNTSCKTILPPRNRRRRVLLSSEDDTSLENVHIDNNKAGDQEWFDTRGNQSNITDFTSVYGADANNIEPANLCQYRRVLCAVSH